MHNIKKSAGKLYLMFISNPFEIHITFRKLIEETIKIFGRIDLLVNFNFVQISLTTTGAKCWFIISRSI
jgi:hypothetical protein